MTATLSYAATAPCWVCGGALGDRFHAATLDFAAWHEQDPELAAYTGERVWLQRCRGCGFAQPEQIPALPRYFERMYDQRWAPEWVAAEFESPYKDVIFARILDELARRVPGTPRTLLDIGSHAGRFLHLATRAGWHADGTEINARTAAYAAERSGATVHRVRAERVIDLGRRYDAVTLTDVLEHIPEPVQMLATARMILAPGGWVAVKVPCGPAQLRKETWRARVSRGYRATLADNLVHVNHFSPRSLRRALERAGFAAIEIEVAAPECPPGSRAAAAARMTLWRAARALPFGVHTPMALHLQAFARRTSDA